MEIIKLSLCIFRYPVDTFRALQAARKTYSYLPAVVLLALLGVGRLAAILIMHYPLATVDPQDANMLVEMLMVLIPVVAFSLIHFAVSSIMNGEATIKESFTAAVFATMPLLLFQVPIAALSHLMSLDDGAIFGILNGFVYIWVGLLVVVSVKTMNNYSLLRTLSILFIDLLGLALLAAVAILMYALSSQFVSFITGIYREVRFALGR